MPAEGDAAIKRTLEVDRDNVLVDLPSAFPHVAQATLAECDGRLDGAPGIFTHMNAIPGAVEATAQLAEAFDTDVPSTSPWENPSAWPDKLLWVKRHPGQPADQRLLRSHRENLNDGDCQIGDRLENGADWFGVERRHLGTPRFPDWQTVSTYLLPART